MVLLIVFSERCHGISYINIVFGINGFFRALVSVIAGMRFRVVAGQTF